MAEFEYQGVDKSGKKLMGKLDAPSDGDLRMILRGMGIRPIRIKRAGVLNRDLGKLFSGGDKKVPLEALVMFTRQLNVLISAGIPLVQALEVLGDQGGDKALRNIVLATKERVSAGSYLWEALSQYPRSFPKLYIALVRAGETAGAMDQVLKRLSKYLEDADKLRKTLKAAMIYPIVVITLSIAVVAGLLLFIIPKFEDLLKGAGQELPGLTQFLINISHAFAHNIIFIAGLCGTGYYMIKKYVATPEGKRTLDRLIFKSPIFGPIAQKAGVARFSRTMQTLLSSGVNLIDAIEICRATIDNAVLEDAVGKIRSEVEAGKSLGSVVNNLPAFPRMAIQMISVGEATGSLDKMLDKVAEFYETEVETLVGGLTKIIEPLLLVVLGGLVGFVLVAMYLPVFKMAGGA